MSLKTRKEDFVSGLVGGSSSEIYIVTSVSLVSALIEFYLTLDQLYSMDNPQTKNNAS